MFDKISLNRPKSNVFNLTHERKFSMKMGNLVPVLCEEVIPGDKFRINTEMLMRMAPMIAPIMHRVDIKTEFFFVPNRLIWNEWEDFITGGADGTLEPVMPYLSPPQASTIAPGSLADYLGCSSEVSGFTAGSTKINALPFRAYQLIYNEYYRDQNLTEEIPIDLGSGLDSDSAQMMILRYRAWEKDYFTSALPFTQRGADVSLPLTGNAEVILNDVQNYVQLKQTDGSDSSNSTLATVQHHIDSGVLATTTPTPPTPLKIDPNGTLEADMNNVSSSTIVELRRALSLQRWFEKNARGGSRYIEQILSHFGVRSKDSRLQRPEFLGSGKTPLVISEVLQTSATDTDGPQGNLAGHGVSAGVTHSFNKSFTEHGYIIGLVSVLPRTTYQQGIRRHLMKKDRYDYFWPDFAHIGEQEVYNSELYHTYDDDFDKDAFGYQARYSEYKYIPSSVHGEFKDSLLFWHMGRKFSSPPLLNTGFVQSNPTTRIFAVTQEETLYVQAINHVKAIRPMPYFSNPHI